MKHTIHLVKWKNPTAPAKELPNVDAFHSMNDADTFAGKMRDRGCDILAEGRVSL